MMRYFTRWVNMVKIFIWIVFMNTVIFAEINYAPTLLSQISKYDEDVIIFSKKLQKYKNSIEKSMENMRHSIGITTGEPYLFTFEITETDIKNNVMKAYITLSLGRYRTIKDERAFFQNLYSDYREVSLDIDDESIIKLQLMHTIEDMLKHFKMMYIDDN